jgi:hypothetical protein
MGFSMKKLNELIIFFLDICYSLKNIHFIKMNEELQNEQLLDHIRAIRTVINMHLNNLEKELSEDNNNIDLDGISL